MINFAKYMRKQKGVEVAYSDFKPNEKNIVKWEQEFDSDKQDKIIADIDMLLANSDVSVWQMVHTGLSLAMFNRCRDMLNKKKPVLMEIDDYVHAVNPESAGYSAYHNNSDLEYYAEMQMRNANLLIASTQWLADKYKSFCPCVEVIPNSIDFEIWDPLVNHTRDGKVRIGWAGGQPHEKDLKILERVIPVILGKYKQAEFMFMGFKPDSIPTSRRVRHVSAWHNIYDYPKEMSKLGFDIGVAPLRDNLFNRAKSNLRYLEYSALKIPTVASPVEPFKHDFTGLHALEVDDWVKQLSDLIEHKEKRHNMGIEAYHNVRKLFNAEKTASKYTNLLKSIVEGKREINMMIYEDKGNGTIIRRVDL
jgi:glycosyltransferase involved in cell wall biosynthesis